MRSDIVPGAIFPDYELSDLSTNCANRAVLGLLGEEKQ